MRTLDRNKQTFHYATYLGKTDMYDDDGYMTGESAMTYSEWKEYSANISAATGESQIEQFGNSEQYDRVIVTDDVNCEIDENTILCVDIEAIEGNTKVFDYIVKKKAKSLNSVSYAISKVKIDA